MIEHSGTQPAPPGSAARECGGAPAPQAGCTAAGRWLARGALVAFVLAVALLLVPAIAAASEAGTIAGTVTAAGGAPIADMPVCAIPQAGAEEECRETNSEGKYELSLAAPETYKLEFSGEVCVEGPCEARYVRQFYEDAATLGEATDITLAEGASETADAELQEGGAIEGTVSRETLHSTPPLPDAEVCVYSGEELPRCTLSDTEGKYVLMGLPTGAYDVEFTGEVCESICSATYVPQYYEDAATAATATAVDVTAPAHHGGIDATLEESNPGTPVNTEAPELTPNVKTAPGRTLTCSEGQWSDNPTRLEYDWLRDGAAIPGQHANTYEVQAGDEGTKIACKVIATNHSGSESATSNAVTVAEKPRNTTPPALTGEHGVGKVLHCAEGTWANEPSSYEYAWLRNGTVIEHQSSNTYTTESGEEGQSITCTVTATNEVGSRSETSNAIVVLSKPKNTAPPVAGGDPGAESVLSCSEGEWEYEHSPPEYVWIRNGSEIGGQTASTYTVSRAEEGDSIGCRVTVKNESGSASAASAEVEIDRAPQSSAAPLLSGTPRVGSVLHCSEGFWTTPIRRHAYAWLRSGVPIAGQSSNSYTVQTADEGTAISCEVTASNYSGSARATSNAVEVPHGAPSSHPSEPTTTATTSVVKPISAALATATATLGGSITVNGHFAILTLSCPGPGVCKGMVTLTVGVTEEHTVTRHGKHVKVKQTRAVTVCQTPFSLAARSSQKPRVKLTTSGERLLRKAGKKGLTVRVGGSGVRAGSALLKKAP